MLYARHVTILVATGRRVLVVDPDRGAVTEAEELAGKRSTCLAADPRVPARAWCGTSDEGLWRTDDGGRTWRAVGLDDQDLTAVAADPVVPGRVWAGTEPSRLWRSEAGSRTWKRADGLQELPSSSEWAFPPRPETHHVRWIACHPHEAGRLWVAIEAGALISTPDAGRTWRDRVPGGPYDTHELAIHPDRPDTLRVAAGDGYYESLDGGETWSSPADGLEVDYLRSVAIDPGEPDTVLVSAASHPHKAYVAGKADGRLYRRAGAGAWERVTGGWPDPPDTIAPLLTPGREPGELFAADERGLHRSGDGGRNWERITPFDPTPSSLRGLAAID